MPDFSPLGVAAAGFVLWLAGFLRDEAAPGFVSIALLLGLVAALVHLWLSVWQRRAALRWLRRLVATADGEADFSDRIVDLDQRVENEGNSGSRRTIAAAWHEYRQTLVAHEEAGRIIQRNAVRPAVFFNLEDLKYGAGFWRILPALFVTIGLFLTFLGLISALDTMGNEMADTGELSQVAMTNLLAVASAKFIMSLTGLFCSIMFTIELRRAMGAIESDVHGLNADLEKRLSFISLEDLAVEQLAAMREQREHFRKIGMELVAELGRPLREEVPQAISGAITTAMAPILSEVGKTGSEGVGRMVSDLSSRFSDDVGRALGVASDRLAEAGDRIASLVDRMDQSSGRMGSEMNGAVAQLGQAVNDLRTAMTAGAEATSGAFSEGAETILGAMKETLEGIRTNTAESAAAMRSAADGMRTAAEGVRNELEAAARLGADAASIRMQEAGVATSEAIGKAGSDVLGAFQAANGEIAAKLEDMVRALDQGAAQAERASTGLRTGADASERAASIFRSSADALVAASDPVQTTVARMEQAMRQLTDSTRSVAESTRNSAAQTAQVLAAAQEALGGEQRAIQATLEQLSQALERMRGQGDRLDEVDQKLGAAFERYAREVETAVQGLFGHVKEMQNKLNPALDTMREIVEQAEQFAPQSKRH